MKIERIEISNFKSIAELSVELSNFNLLVGANAAGKSNVVQSFLFLKDIAIHGLENAISGQGGVQYLRNLNLANERPMCFRLVMSSDENTEWIPGVFLDDVQSRRSFRTTGALLKNFDYKFKLRFHKSRSGFTVEQDEMALTFERRERDKEAAENSDALDRTVVLSKSSRGKLRIETLPERKAIRFFGSVKIPTKTLLLESPFAHMYAAPIRDWFQKLGVYDFDPKLTKKSAIPIAGQSELEMDGGNLAVVLNRLLSDKEAKHRFLNLCQFTLPFIHNFGIEKVADRSVYIKLQEKYAMDKDLPAFLISDGTINVVALIVALYFQDRKQFAIFEEPERNIHPYLLSRVMEMFRESSTTKQILATTHNPELLKHAELEDVLLVSRSEEGFTQLARPADSEQVKVFLENEMGIDDLFLSNLLGV